MLTRNALRRSLAWLSLLALGLAASACRPTTAGSACRLTPSAPCKHCVDCLNAQCVPAGCADAGPGVSTCAVGTCRVPCKRDGDCFGASDCDHCGPDGFCAQNLRDACGSGRTGFCHPTLDACGGVVICSPCPAGQVCGVEGACVAADAG